MIHIIVPVGIKCLGSKKGEVGQQGDVDKLSQNEVDFFLGFEERTQFPVAEEVKKVSDRRNKLNKGREVL